MSFRLVLFLIVFMAVLPVSHGGSSLQEIFDLLEFSQRQKEQQDKAIVRPTPQERAAIQELLDMSPPPKTLIPADRKFLQELWDKVAWTGLERKIMHMIYKEVHGKEIALSAPDK